MVISWTIAALISTGAQAEERPFGRPDLLRAIHANAYLSPGICPGADQVAVQVFNVSDNDRTGVMPVDFGAIEIILHGRSSDIDRLMSDAPQTITGNLTSGEDSIRCVESSARRAGATRFTVEIAGATFRLRD